MWRAHAVIALGIVSVLEQTLAQDIVTVTVHKTCETTTFFPTYGWITTNGTTSPYTFSAGSSASSIAPSPPTTSTCVTAAPSSVSCPESNGTLYTPTGACVGSGDTFVIFCDTNFASSGLVRLENIQSEEVCIQLCSQDVNCVAVAYDTSDNSCYEKSTVSTGSATADGNLIFAIRAAYSNNPITPSRSTTFLLSTSAVVSSLPTPSSNNVPSSTSKSTTVAIPTSTISPTSSIPPAPSLCPGANQTSYTSDDVNYYTIYCDVSSTGSYRTIFSTTFAECISACNSDESCTAVSFNDSVCNLISPPMRMTSSPGTIYAARLGGSGQTTTSRTVTPSTTRSGQASASSSMIASMSQSMQPISTSTARASSSSSMQASSTTIAGASSSVSMQASSTTTAGASSSVSVQASSTSSAATLTSESMQATTTAMTTTTSTTTTTTAVISSSEILSPGPTFTSPPIACSDGAIYNGMDGRQYIISCDSDTSGNGGAVETVNFLSGDFTQCAGECDQRAYCGAWVWGGPGGPGEAGGACYLKEAPQTPIPGRNGMVVGILIGAQSSASSTVSINSYTPSSSDQAASVTPTQSSLPDESSISSSPSSSAAVSTTMTTTTTAITAISTSMTSSASISSPIIISPPEVEMSSLSSSSLSSSMFEATTTITTAITSTSSSSSIPDAVVTTTTSSTSSMPDAIVITTTTTSLETSTSSSDLIPDVTTTTTTTDTATTTTTTSTMTTSSSSSSSAPAAPSPTCAAQDGSSYQAADSSTFVLLCNRGFQPLYLPGSPIQLLNPTLEACVEQCAAQGTECAGTTWGSSDGSQQCYLYSKMLETDDPTYAVTAVVRTSNSDGANGRRQILDNGGFDGTLAPWASGTANDSSQFTVINDAATAIIASGDSNILSQEISQPAVGNAGYYFMMDVGVAASAGSPSSSSFSCQIDVQNALGDVFYRQVLPPPANIRTMYGSGTIQQGGILNLVINVQCTGTAASLVTFDNIAFYVFQATGGSDPGCSSGNSILQNGDFDTGIPPWTTSQSSGTSATFSVSGGQALVQFSAGAPDNDLASISQSASITSNTNYLLTSNLYFTISAGGTCSVGFANEFETLYFTGQITDSQQLPVSFDGVSDIASANFTIVVSCSGPDANQVGIDTVSLVLNPGQDCPSSTVVSPQATSTVFSTTVTDSSSPIPPEIFTTTTTSTPESTTVLPSSTSSVPSSCPTCDVPVPARAATALCPDNNGVEYDTSDGSQWTIVCSRDYGGSDFAASNAASLSECINLCINTNNCVGVSWIPGTPGTQSPSNICYTKYEMNPSYQPTFVVHSAVRKRGPTFGNSPTELLCNGCFTNDLSGWAGQRPENPPFPTNFIWRDGQAYVDIQVNQPNPPSNSTMAGLYQPMTEASQGDTWFLAFAFTSPGYTGECHFYFETDTESITSQDYYNNDQIPTSGTIYASGVFGSTPSIFWFEYTCMSNGGQPVDVWTSVDYISFTHTLPLPP